MEIHPTLMVLKIVPYHKAAWPQEMLIIFKIRHRVEMITINEKHVHGVLFEHVEDSLPHVLASTVTLDEIHLNIAMGIVGGEGLMLETLTQIHRDTHRHIRTLTVY